MNSSPRWIARMRFAVDVPVMPHPVANLPSCGLQFAGVWVWPHPASGVFTVLSNGRIHSRRYSSARPRPQAGPSTRHAATPRGSASRTGKRLLLYCACEPCDALTGTVWSLLAPIRHASSLAALYTVPIDISTEDAVCHRQYSDGAWCRSEP